MKPSIKVAILWAVAVASLLGTVAATYQFVYLDKVVGKVIIVQQNAHANKLALIEVVAIRREDAHSWRASVARDIAWIIEEERKVVSDWQSRVAESKERAAQAKSRHEVALARVNELIHHAHRVWLIDANDTAAKNRFFSLIAEANRPDLRDVEDFALGSRWQQAHAHLSRSILPAILLEQDDARRRAEEEQVALGKAMDAAVSETQERLRRMLTPESLSRIPANVSIVASDRTDDTGEFVLRVPRGDYYVFAKAGRNVFGNSESYHWAQPVSVPSQLSGKCLLGNMNLMELSDDDLWEDLGTQIKQQRTHK